MLNGHLLLLRKDIAVLGIDGLRCGDPGLAHGLGGSKILIPIFCNVSRAAASSFT